MRVQQWIVVSGCLALGLLLAAPARAQSSELPVYVSDQFRSVAKRASQQLVTAQVTSACPDHKPLCKPIVEQLAAATAAAISQDRPALERALNAFFVQSSVAGLVEIVLGDLADTERSEYPGLAEALAPVSQCLVASVLAGREAGQTLKQCRLDAGQRQRLREELRGLVCEVNPEACPEIETLIGALERRPLEASSVAHGLARLLESAPFHRKRDSLYLYSLGDFLARSPERGLFDATWSFLTSPDSQPWIWEHVGVVETAIASGAFLEYRFLNGTEDDDVRELLKACGQRLDTYEAWVRARGDLSSLREALLVGQDVHGQLAPLRALLTYQQCTGSQARGLELRAMRGQVEYLLVPLELRGAMRRYGVLGLSAAALLDYVRSADSARLDLDLMRAMVFGAAQTVAFQQNARRLRAERGGVPAPEGRLTGLTALDPGDVLGTCEFQRLSALLGQPYTVADPSAPRCFELEGRKPSQGLPDLLDLGEAAESRIELEAAAFAQLLKHAFLQHNIPSGGLDKTRLRQLLGRSEQFLGELMASKSPAVSQAWPEIRESLLRLNASPGDLEARARLQARAISLAASLPVPEGGPTLDEQTFVRLMLDQVPPEEQAELEPFWQQWLARKRQLEALPSAEQAERTALQLRSKALPRPRLVRAFITGTDGQRAAELFKVLRGVLRGAAPDAVAELEQSEAFRALLESVQDGLEGRVDVARRRMMRVGADFLVVQVDTLTVRVVGSEAARCQEQAPEWRSILNPLGAACTAQLLIQSAYHPIADYLSEGGLSAPGAARLADTTYRQVLQSPLLASAPVILNVGLGANWVGVNRPGEDFVALTLIDKFGLALLKYNGPQYGFEVGPFVGGFLDALVRTAAGREEKYWLGGLTVGFPRMAGWDVGVEAHVGGAFPFTFHADPRLTVGASVVVPFSTVFDSEE